MTRRTRTPGPIETNTKARATYLNPASIPGLGLWFDWSIQPTVDLSGAGRNPSYGGNGATYYIRDSDGITSLVNEGSRYVTFTAISARTIIRTLIPHVHIWLMSDSNNYNFHSHDTFMLYPDLAHANAIAGTWRINGNPINPTSTPIAPYLESRGRVIISCVVANSGLSQNRFGFDRSYNLFPHVLCEDLVWTTALTAEQVKQVEHYLALKWKVSNYNFS